MDHYAHFPQQPENLLVELTEVLSLDCRSAQDWLVLREQARATLQQHTEELRQLMSQMRAFNHQTSVEIVMQVQARSEALRWLTQAIEREIQQLDKAYREAAQREQFLRDQVALTAV